MKLLITVTLIHLLALLSPGPDFAMIVKQSVTSSRKLAVFTALGLGLGILVHVSYTLSGIGFIISRSIILFNIIKTLGALYLIFIGLKSLGLKIKLNKTKNTESNKVAEIQNEAVELSVAKSLKLGFLTNVLNPKATLFIISLFSQFISPATGMSVKITLGLWISLITFAYFALLATLFSTRLVRGFFEKSKSVVDKVFGVILVAFGIKILLSNKT